MIAKMVKVTFIGPREEKNAFVNRLQEVGVTHLILPSEPNEPSEIKRELEKTIEAQKFLKRHLAAAESGSGSGEASEICRRLEDLRNQQSRLEADLALLKKELGRSRIWGDFQPDDLAGLREAGLIIKFYRLPLKALETADFGGAAWAEIARTASDAAVAVLSKDSISLNLAEEKDPQPLTRLEAEIAAKERNLADIMSEYKELAKTEAELARTRVNLLNRYEYEKAIRNTDSALEDRLYIVRCWSPVPEAELVGGIGSGFTFYSMAAPPEPGDRVPVLMSNPAATEPGEDLVRVYSFPNPNDFDPSGLVLYCFAIFYGMIVGDFGYGAAQLAITIWLHRKYKKPSPTLKRIIRMSYLLSIAVMVFGVIGGSYLGIPMGPGHPLQKLIVLDLSSVAGQNRVMLISIFFGMIHITLAMAIKLYRQRDWPSLGWILVIWSGYFVIDGKMGGGGGVPTAAVGIMIAGGLLVLIFTSSAKNPLIRFLAGLNGLLGAVQVFSDILSYLRLFALGLATMYMMQTFNTLAGMVQDAVPWIGVVFAAVILIAGHSINFILGIMGGIIHGLRLNFLEWYRWCFEGDGYPFRPFKKSSHEIS